MTEAQKLAHDFLAAKAREAAAKADRIAIETKLCKVLGERDEGSKTHNLETHKVTITQPVNRTFDKKAWAKIEAQVPENLRPIKTIHSLDDNNIQWLKNNNKDVFTIIEPMLTTVTSIDETGVKWLKENDEATYALVAQAITSKPGKPGVKIEMLTPPAQREEVANVA